MASEPDRLNEALADRYRIERELGRGGMAVVYLAEDLRHHRRVALKVLNAEIAAVVGAARFAREIEIAASLSHPHILPLHDSGEAGGFLFYVMPFVEGESLRDRLKREKQLPLDEALQVAREVSDALSYAHSRGVVHRDIKPENILLQSGHAVVADFGIARAISAAGGTTLTETGLVIGTPAYMSPEQATASSDIDGRSDLYAIGCVLYEMLAGQPPFTGPTVESVVHQHIVVQAPNITALRPAVPGWVAAALGRALAKTPADRFNPVAQFAEALAQPAPVSTSPPTASTTRSRRRAQPWMMAVAGLAVVALAWTGWRAISQPGEPVTSLVVLPLENLSGNAEQVYFVNGIHDALIGELGRISALSVISRTTSMAYGRESGKTLAEVARELKVGAVVEGSVFPAGDSVRIEVRVIGLRPERQLWSDSYVRQTGSAVTLMREVTRTIAQQIRVTLTADEVGQLADASPVDATAQDYVLRGRQLLYRRDRDGILGSIVLFREAIRADSLFAPAYAGLTAAFALASAFGHTPQDSAYSWIGKGLAAGNRAVALDSLSAEGYAARGYLGLFHSGPRDQVGRDLARAIALRPSYAEAHGWLAQHLLGLEQYDEAKAAVARARELDPTAVGMRFAWFAVAFAAGDLPAAFDSAHAVRTGNPDNQVAWSFEALVLVALDRAKECLALERLTQSIAPLCLFRAGRTSEAAATAGRLTRSAFASWALFYYLQAGQTDRAMQFMEALYEANPSVSAWTIRSLWDPDREPQGPAYIAAWNRLRGEAWERVVAESRHAKFP